MDSYTSQQDGDCWQTCLSAASEANSKAKHPEHWDVPKECSSRVRASEFSGQFVYQVSMCYMDILVHVLSTLILWLICGSFKGRKNSTIAQDPAFTFC